MPGHLIRRFGALLGAAVLVAAGLPAGVSPARAVSPDIVISQVYGGGGNTGAPYTHDFVELFNRGTTPVSISGWSVQYASATGTGTFGGNPITLLSGTLGAGQHYLVQLASGGANGVALPTPDATGTANMSGTAGKVIVANTTTGLACNGGSTPCSTAQLALIVDLVGYGGANFFEGSAAPTLSNTTAALRLLNGCTETDSNAADFAVGSPAPRNTASPLSPCGVPASPLINEFSASTVGTDVEYVEINGAPATDYSALTVLEIEGDGSGAGVVDEVIAVGTTDANGLYLASLPANALENGTITLLLVRAFTGVLGNDLDTDNDGLFDTNPWDAIVDAVAVNDGGAGDLTYGLPALGPNYDGLSLFAPGGASRIPDGFDTDAASDWVRNDFDLAGIPGFTGTLDLGEALNTPGAPNELVVPADAAPAVVSTLPGPGATGVPVGADISITFSEPVNLTGAWYSISCTASGTVTAGVSGGPTTFTLDPTSDLAFGETCTVTVYATQVADQDADDPPDNMVDDHAWSFATAAVDPCTLGYTPIYAIQGSGPAAAITGAVTTQGVVVGDHEGPSPALRGFYLQDPAGDGDAATSDGIFVFNGNANSVSLGDVVRVTGTATEFQGQTQISASGIAACGSGTVAPADVTFPVPDATYLERYEGMLVRLPQAMSVTETFQLGRFGQVVLSSSGRLRQPTNVVLPGAPALALQAANDLDRIILDDALQSQNPDPIVFGRGGLPLSASNTLRGGDTATNTVGVMTYTWAGNAASGNAWRLRPVNALGGFVDFQPTNPRPTSAPDVGGSLKVVGMNLLNYFNTFDGLPDTVDNCTQGVGGIATDCRGADTPDEFGRQAAKSVAALVALDADVLGFTELENDGYGPTSALQDLVDRLNAATAPGTYALVDADAGTGAVNALGLDAIKVGMIFKPATVTPVGRTAVLSSVAFVNGGDPDIRNRPALAQAFAENATGARFVGVVNHLKSKGSACVAPDAGDGQGNCNLVRVNAATELLAWLATDPTGTGDPDVLLVGDYNSYAMEDPIAVFEGAGYTNLISSLLGPDAYSYVFDGQWGYLDHALASAGLVSRVTGVADYHINADEPSVLDYNTDFKSAGQIASLFAPDEFRTSDHDPVVVGLDLGIPTTTTLTVTPGSQQYSDTVSLSASISPSEATGTVQFRKSTDGGATFSDLGVPVPVVGGAAQLGNLQVLDAAGTQVRFQAVFLGTNDYVTSDDAGALTVTREDATILYDAGNPVAAQVTTPGGGSWAGPLTLGIGVRERYPDGAGAGTAGIGDIANAGLSVQLVPLGPGGSIGLACSPSAVVGAGYGATRPFSCTSPGAIPLGTYEVVVDVTGSYYAGTYADAFTVYDPSLGFATGGGTFLLAGDRVNFGFTMKYNKKGTSVQGGFIAVRHHADGTVSRLKSNALGGLAILDAAGCGIATFNGKATYTTWDPTANGGLGDYVTTGGNTFSVRADDCNNPGTGTDKIWVGGPGTLAMASPAGSNLAPLNGGNIVVPHTIGKK